MRPRSFSLLVRLVSRRRAARYICALHVLQQDGAHAVGGVLGRVRAVLHVLEDARPHHHAHGVLAIGGVQIADDVHQQLVGLFLVGVHLDDERLELLGLLEARR